MKMPLWVALTFLLAAADGVAADKPPTGPRDPAFQKLDFLLGVWTETCSLQPGPFGPAEQPCTGETRYRWGTGGLWLTYDATLVTPGRETYEVHGLVSYDASLQHYTAFAFNNMVPRGMEYTGQWTDNNTLVFTSVHNTPRNTVARVVYARLRDGNVAFSSEESQADGSFKPYFEAVLKRK